MDGLVVGQQGRFTRLSKVLSAILVLGCVVTLVVPSSRGYLALVPGRTLPCVWNVVTAGFITSNPLKMAVEVVSLLLLARVIEPIYGSTEFLKLILLVDVITSVLTVVGVYCVFAASQGTRALVLYTEFTGFHGIIGALLVSVKQIMPDHEVKLFGAIQLKARYFPSVYVLVYGGLVMATLRGTGGPFLVFLLLGTYISWVYLRFFQQQPDTALRGDPSQDFKFSSFFPDFMEGPVDAVAGVLGVVFQLRHSAEAVAHHKTNVLPVTQPILGADSADAARRRERGAKALEERLGQKAAAAATSKQGGSPAHGSGEGGDLEGLPQSKMPSF